MALRNGILVHSLDHWAAAVRDRRRRDQDGVRPQARPARRAGRHAAPARRRADGRGRPSCCPVVRRRLPEARLPVEGPGMGAALAGSALLAQARRGEAACIRSSASRSPRRRRWLPALMALRGSRDRRLPRRRAQGDRRLREGHRRGRRARRSTSAAARTWSARCWSLTAAGNALASRLPESRRGPARLAVGVAALGAADRGVRRGWGATATTRVARALSRPGLRAPAGRRDPRADGRRARGRRDCAGEVLRLEGVRRL